MHLGGYADERQSSVNSLSQTPSSLPTDSPTVSQAASLVLENILPQQTIETLASSTTQVNATDDAPLHTVSLTPEKVTYEWYADEESGYPRTSDLASEVPFARLMSISKLAMPGLDTKSEFLSSMNNIEQSHISSLFSGDIEEFVSALKVNLEQHRIASFNRDDASCLNELANGNQMYLIAEQDIADIVRRVMTALHDRRGSTQEQSLDEKNTQHQRPSLPRPDLHNIQPTPAVVADPATSISIPNTSFAVAGSVDSQIHTKTRQLDNLSTTMIVSRTSISRITWAPDTLLEVPDSRDEPHLGPFDHVTSATSMTTVETQNGQFQNDLPDMATYNPFVIEHSETRGGGNKRCENSMFSNEEDARITSFPELRSRHCTNEWLKPPPEIKKTVEVAEEDLYLQGVDAHSGVPSRISVIVLEGDPPKPRHCNHDLFGENPFCEAVECSTTLPVPCSPPLSVAEKRLGASIGTSAHRRQSSQAISQQPGSVVEDSDSLVPGLMDKIRRSGRKIFKHRTHKSSDQRSGEFATPYNSPDDNLAQNAIRSRDSIIKERTLEPPQVDHAGIYEALTGSRLVNPRRRGTCSEDNRPHVCEDDHLSAESPMTPQ